MGEPGRPACRFLRFPRSAHTVSGMTGKYRIQHWPSCIVCVLTVNGNGTLIFRWPRYCPGCKTPFWRDPKTRIDNICQVCTYLRDEKCLRRWRKPVANKCKGFDPKRNPMPVLGDPICDSCWAYVKGKCSLDDPKAHRQQVPALYRGPSARRVGRAGGFLRRTRWIFRPGERNYCCAYGCGCNAATGKGTHSRSNMKSLVPGISQYGR